MMAFRSLDDIFNLDLELLRYDPFFNRKDCGNIVRNTGVNTSKAKHVGDRDRVLVIIRIALEVWNARLIRKRCIMFQLLLGFTDLIMSRFSQQMSNALHSKIKIFADWNIN